jgi:hypothetical protein
MRDYSVVIKNFSCSLDSASRNDEMKSFAGFVGFQSIKLKMPLLNSARRWE